MSDEKFYKEVDLMFEQYLTPKKDNLGIRIRNIEKNKILSDSDMNYSKVFFDSNLNLYKVDSEGSISRVDNPNFEVIVVKIE